MSDINQEARIPVYINDEQAKSALQNLTNEAEKWRKKMYEAMAGGDLKGLKEAERELKKVNGQMNSIKKEAFDVNKVLSNISSASPKDLKKALAAVNREMEGLNRNTKEYQALMSKKTALRTELNSINGPIKEQAGFFSKAANAANKYFNMIAIGIATLTGVAFSLAQFIKGMIGLDDALADVQKTTGLTRKEVRELYQDFKLLNTRTPRAELLKLAEEAGRLGKTGRKDILAFVEVANKIKIALGDDLGGNAEEAIREVGKLTEIFKIGDQYGTDFKVSMEKVGSGINTVANNSNASAGYLIEYMKRLGGTAVQARITAADIMGYAATFDQLGQNVEMAATAQSKIIVDMFTDPAKYARIAKMEVQSFSNLLQTDANEAFLKFLEGLNGNNEGLSIMAGKLDSLGIDGARAIQALAALSSNTKMLREQQSTANDAMQKGISLNNEYAIKNENLAGSWAKLTAFINAQFINSNLLGFLENVISKLAKMTEVTHPLTKAMKDEVSQVNLLTIELTNSNTPAARRNEIYEELKKLAPDVVANIDAENISISTLRGNLEKYNQEMIKKLALQDSEETLADKREAAGKATSERIEYELKLQKEMNSLLQTYKTYDAQKAKQIEDVLFSSETAANKYIGVVKLVNNVDFSPKTSKFLQQALKDEKTATDDVTKSLEAYMQRYELVFGKTGTDKDPNVPKVGDTKSIDGKLFKWDGKEWKPVAIPKNPVIQDTATQALDLAYASEVLRIKQYYADKENLDKESKARLLASELAYLQTKAQLEPDQLAKVNLQSQIIDKQREYAAALKDTVPELLKNREEIESLNGRLLEEAKLLGLATAKQNDAANATEELKAKTEMQRDMILATADVMAQSIYDLASGGEDALREAGKNILLFALDMLKMQAQIAIAGATIQSLAQPDSVATFGATGLVRAAILAGLIEVAFAGVKGLVSAAFDSGKSKGYYAGGDTGPGGKYEVAGVVHKREYVIPSEGTENPQLRPFIDLIEIARRNGSLARLDLRPVVQSISPGKKPGSAQTSYSSPSFTGSPESGSGSSSQGLDAATANRLASAIEKFTNKKWSIAVETVKNSLKELEEIDKNTGL